jgi:hypothetical protein
LEKTSIYKKLLTVIDEVKRIPKNGYNSFHKYHYVTESDLTESIRPILAKAGLVFLPPSVLEQEKIEVTKVVNGKEEKDYFTKVKMEFTLADAETGEVIKSIFWGEGQDKGDKGLYKAYTGATKYFLMKTFLIATGDDPEEEAPKNTTTTTKTTQGKQSYKKPQQQYNKQSQTAQQQTTQQPTQPQQNKQQPQASGIQRKRFFAIAGKKQISDKQQKAIIYFYTGKDSRAVVTEIEYQQINEVLDKATIAEINHTVAAAVQKKQAAKGGAA